MPNHYHCVLRCPEGGLSPAMHSRSDADSYDVVVTGAGPAGGMTAAHIAEAGLSVLVLEEHPEVGLLIRTRYRGKGALSLIIVLPAMVALGMVI